VIELVATRVSAVVVVIAAFAVPDALKPAIHAKAKKQSRRKTRATDLATPPRAIATTIAC
jgi:hypothetical protein